MKLSAKKNVENLDNSQDIHRSEKSQNESSSYGLKIGDLVFMSELVPGNSSIPGLLLSLPSDKSDDSRGTVDVLYEGTKRTVYWNQVKPYIDNME